jgi:hypothetical protein
MNHVGKLMRRIGFGQVNTNYDTAVYTWFVAQSLGLLAGEKKMDISAGALGMTIYSALKGRPMVGLPE